MKGYFRKRGDKWSFSIDLPRDPVTNQRKQKTVSGFNTKKEAEKACAALITEIERDEYVEITKKTVADFFAEWLQGKELSVKKVTYEQYGRHINIHIVPFLGKHELMKLSRDHILKFYKHLVSEKEISPRTLFDIHNLLSRALTQATAWQMIRRNIMDTIDTPKVPKKQINVWNLEECAQFLSFSKDDRLHMAFLLALTTGMRQSEILGLRWKDVDLDAGALSVTQILDHQGKEFHVGTKTNAGSRLISIDEETVAAIKAHKRVVGIERLKLGAAYEDFDLVVPTTLGTPMGPRNVLRTFYRLIEKSGVTKIAFHDLRHTHATLLLSQGVNPKIVSERLGHANVKITLDTYSHVLPNMQKETAANFGKVFYFSEVAAENQSGQNVVKG